MDRPAVVVLFGGRSSEHSISSATAGGVLRAISRDRYRVIPVGITRRRLRPRGRRPRQVRARRRKLPEVVDNGTRILWPEGGGIALCACGARRLDRRARRRRCRAADPARRPRRGRHRQGFFDTLGDPYAGGGVLDSALCMDKHFMKIVLQAPACRSRRGSRSRGRGGTRTPTACERMPRPRAAGVRQARAGGSSVGVSKVARRSNSSERCESPSPRTTRC
jgi:D-alanine-D-alanine ligase